MRGDIKQLSDEELRIEIEAAEEELQAFKSLILYRKGLPYNPLASALEIEARLEQLISERRDRKKG